MEDVMMKALFLDAMIYDGGVMKKADMLFDGTSLSVFSGNYTDTVDVPVFSNVAIFPGFCDVHVHLREPGFSYKETIASGTMASAGGGYTCVCAMPNLKPAPDCRGNLDLQLDIIRRDAVISVVPYGTITYGERGDELSDMRSMAADVAGFSDDGRGVQDREMMREAMLTAKGLGKMIVAHCEDDSLLRGGYVHDGDYAHAHGHRGICSESEWGPIKRDIELLKETGCAYHVCHISTKESVELIRRAKAEGVNITCETGPHYALLDDSDLREDGRFKMNPPLRSSADREAIIEGLCDGTIDMIATDHAPHSDDEKSKGLKDSSFGVVGIETCFPLVYTYLVKPGIISMERAVELLSINPRKRFDIKSDAGFTVFSLGQKHVIDPSEFISKGKSTPFLDVEVEAKCLLTVYEKRVVYSSI